MKSGKKMRYFLGMFLLSSLIGFLSCSKKDKPQLLAALGNQAPLFKDGEKDAPIDKITSVSLVAEDPEEDTIRFSLGGSYQGISLANNVLEVDPIGYEIGQSIAISVIAADEYNETGATITINVVEGQSANALGQKLVESIFDVTVAPGTVEKVDIVAVDASVQLDYEITTQQLPGFVKFEKPQIVISPPEDAENQVIDMTIFVATQDGKVSQDVSFSISVEKLNDGTGAGGTGGTGDDEQGDDEQGDDEQGDDEQGDDENGDDENGDEEEVKKEEEGDDEQDTDENVEEFDSMKDVFKVWLADEDDLDRKKACKDACKDEIESCRPLLSCLKDRNVDFKDLSFKDFGKCLEKEIGGGTLGERSKMCLDK